MNRGVRVLVRKEVLSILRNPQMIASLVLIPLMFIAMGGITSIGIQKAVEEAKQSNILLVLEDNSPLAIEAAKALKALGLKVLMGNKTLSKPLKQVAIIIPRGFTAKLEEYLEGVEVEPPSVRIIVPIETISVASAGKLNAATTVAQKIEEAFKTIIAQQHGLPSRLTKLHLNIAGEAIIYDKKLEIRKAQAAIGALASTFFVALFVIALAAQYAALSMAQEKEDKAFETLLSQPIPRSSIGIAKTIGALIVTLIQVALFAASWYYYMAQVSSAGEPGKTLRTETYKLVLDLISPAGATTIIAEILVAAIGATIIGLIAGGLSRDTKTAGALIGPLWMLVVGAGLTAQMIGIPATTTTGLLGATIILGPPLALQATIAGNTLATTTTIASTLATTLLLLYILKKLLESETMITGIPLKQKLAKLRKQQTRNPN